ncbi:MAG TPA: YceI family protein [Burkholderiaceae bacterium]
MRSLFRPLLLAGLLAAPLTYAAPLKTDMAKSRASVVFKQIGVPVEAPFKKFSAVIDYDPAKPQAASARVEIEVASFDLGMAEMNQEVVKKEWFNAAQFPKATFVSTAIKAGAAGFLQASGKLTVKGRVLDVSFPVSVRKDGAATVFEGSLPIRRLAFLVGEGDWKDTDTVADEVTIKFRITAQ